MKEKTKDGGMNSHYNLDLYEEHEEGQNLFACLMRCLREQKREDILHITLKDSCFPYFNNIKCG